MADALPATPPAAVQQAAAAPAGKPGTVQDGKLIPTAEQLALGLNTTGNFAVEGRHDGSYHIVLEPFPPITQVDEASLARYKAITNSATAALSQIGFQVLGAEQNPQISNYGAANDKTKLDVAHPEVALQDGNLRRPPQEYTGISGADQGYGKFSLLPSIAIAPINPTAAMNGNVDVAQDVYQRFVDALKPHVEKAREAQKAAAAAAATNAPAATPAPAVVAAAPAPAATNAAPAAPPPPAFKVPNAGELNATQKEFFAKVRGYRIEANDAGQVTVQLAPTSRLVGNDPSAGPRLNGLTEEAKNAFTALGATVVSAGSGTFQQMRVTQITAAEKAALPGNVKASIKVEDPAANVGNALGGLAGSIGLNRNYNTPVVVVLQGDPKQPAAKNAADAEAMIGAIEQAVPARGAGQAR